MRFDEHLKEIAPGGIKVDWVSESAVKKKNPVYMLGCNHEACPDLVRAGHVIVSRPDTKKVRDEYKHFHTTPTGVEVHELREAAKMSRDGMPYLDRGGYEWTTEDTARNKKMTRGADGGAHRSATRLEGRYNSGEISKQRALELATHSGVERAAAHSRGVVSRAATHSRNTLGRR